MAIKESASDLKSLQDEITLLKQEKKDLKRHNEYLEMRLEMEFEEKESIQENADEDHSEMVSIIKDLKGDLVKMGRRLKSREEIIQDLLSYFPPNQNFDDLVPGLCIQCFEYDDLCTCLPKDD